MLTKPILFSDGYYLYVGLTDSAEIVRTRNAKVVDSLSFSGYTHIHKLWVQSDLFALVSNDRTSEIAILDINVTSFTVSKSVVL